ncbi:hypothetical protein K523DRAFT_152254 [Schizophyllum commune Tattone D]|nr:hypothetical protein K523DRAFT_152254 [Schizophyllum commune Tattone D]
MISAAPNVHTCAISNSPPPHHYAQAHYFHGWGTTTRTKKLIISSSRRVVVASAYTCPTYRLVLTIIPGEYGSILKSAADCFARTKS